MRLWSNDHEGWLTLQGTAELFEFRLVQAQDTGHPAGVLRAIHGTVCVNPMACPGHHWGSLPARRGGLICY